MLKIFFKTFFRNLWKNKAYSFLNIFGLAVGIACAALIFLWIENELTYNHYFSNRNNLYLLKDQQTYDGTTFTFDATPGPLAQSMKTDFPGLKNTARTTWGNSLLFSLNNKTLYQQGLYVDSNFLSMFSLQFVNGTAAHAFDELHSIVLSEKMAKNFFGTTDVIGKTLKVDNKENYIISGVIKDLPKNVSFRFDWLASFQNYLNQNQWLSEWGNNGIVTYAEVQPTVNVNAINKKLYGYVQTKKDSTTAKLSLYPMSRWRMYNSFDTNGKETEGQIKYVHLFSIIAWIILIIACINFMNLATARSEQRAREVGVRKVLGALKTKLINQFIAESICMSAISMLLAILIVVLCLPAFNTLVEKQLSLDLLNPLHTGILLLLTVLCGLIAGSYPAFYLSSFKPITVLKSLKINIGGGAGFIRRSLVVLQFTVSVILIICTIIIYQQINHVKNRDLGYSKQNLVYTFLEGRMKENFGAIKNDLLQTGMVQNAGISNSTVLSFNSNSGSYKWEGKDPAKDVLITGEGVSPEYLSTMNMHLKAGRDFYSNIKSDSNNIIINEALAKIISKKNALGKIITSGDERRFTVVGVVENFVYNDMYSAAAPLIFYADTSGANVLSIRFKAGTALTAGVNVVEEVIKKDNPGYPVDINFVDEQFNHLFKTESLIGKLSNLFSILAIVISCLGLFGLTAYTAERRRKEIGIRKILGASITGITTLLSKDFIKLVALSCLIAFPVSWWMMHNWLQNYKYRIEIRWWIFLAAGMSAILIALITISFQSVKAAIANPVKSLRTE